MSGIMRRQISLERIMEKKEFDAEIEATEDQETVDPETEITLSEVMQEAVDQEVALADLEAGESITFDMPMMLASGETGTKSVTVTAGSWYYYADYSHLYTYTKKRLVCRCKVS